MEITLPAGPPRPLFSLAHTRFTCNPMCDQKPGCSHVYICTLGCVYARGYLQAHTSNTYANIASMIMMLIKNIITGSYMFIEGPVLLSKRLHL